MSTTKKYRIVTALANLPSSSANDGDFYFVRENSGWYVWDQPAQQMKQVGAGAGDVEIADVDGLQTALDALDAADTSEATTRGSADVTLQDNINSEATARQAADGGLSSTIGGVEDDLATEATTRANADSSLSSSIFFEAATRASADSTLQANIDAKQDALGFTAQRVSNMAPSTSLGTSNTLYPSQNAVKVYVDAETTARGAADTTLQTNINAKQDSLGFTAENVANKDIDSTFTSNSDTKYPSQKAVKTAIAAKQDSLGFTAENSANKDQNSGYAGLTSGGLLKAAEFPTPTSSAFGGVKDKGAVSHNFATSMVDGVLVLAQPAAADLSEGTVGAGEVALARFLRTNQTSTPFAFSNSDKGNIIELNRSAGVINVATIAQAGAASAFLVGWWCRVKNVGTDVWKLTPTTSNIEGVTAVIIPPGSSFVLYSDGTNFRIFGIQFNNNVAGTVLPHLASSIQASTSAAWTANRVWFFEFNLPFAQAIRIFKLYIQTGVASSHVGAAIFDTNGNLLLESGAIGSASSTTLVSATVGTPLLFLPGTYRVAFTTDSNTVSVEYWSNQNSLAVSGAMNASRVRVGRGSNASTAGVFPSTLGTETADTVLVGGVVTFVEA